MRAFTRLTNGAGADGQGPRREARPAAPRLKSLMAHAKRNLTEIEDSAVRFGLSETQSARFPAAELGAEQTGLNYLILRPGRREAFAHRHREAEEIYVVLAGSGRVKLDDDLVELERLDVVRVGPGVTRAFEAGDDGLEVIVSARTSRTTPSWSTDSGAAERRDPARGQDGAGSYAGAGACARVRRKTAPTVAAAIAKIAATANARW